MVLAVLAVFWVSSRERLTSELAWSRTAEDFASQEAGSFCR